MPEPADEEIYRALGREVEASLGDPDMTFRGSRQRARLQVGPSRRGSGSWGTWVAALCGLVLTAALAAFMSWPRTQPVEAQEMAKGSAPSVDTEATRQWREAPAGGRVGLGLGPHAQAFLVDGARGAVRSEAEQGAEVSLDSGRIELEITPGTGGRWSVVAGPFEVRVVGTVFSVDWDPVAHRLVVEVERGAVRVFGAHLPHKGLDVSAGRRAAIEAETQRTTVEAQGSRARAPSGAADRSGPQSRLPSKPAQTKGEARAGEERVPGRASSPPVEPDWKTLFEEGLFADSLAAVERKGFDQWAMRGSSRELGMLADLARLNGQASRAIEVLEQLRRRFRGTNAAANAAFELGLLTAEAKHDQAGARAWFGVYLAERPKGTYVQDARGRILRSLAKHGGDEALAAARDYLKHHPDGPDAESARELLSR